MTYEEREQLKEFARRGENLEQTLFMIAHWMRCTQDVSFSGFAANWATANRSEAVSAILRQWPLVGDRFIADNSSEWGSAKKEA
jgi:hypothetical protein